VFGEGGAPDLLLFEETAKLDGTTINLYVPLNILPSAHESLLGGTVLASSADQANVGGSSWVRSCWGNEGDELLKKIEARGIDFRVINCGTVAGSPEGIAGFAGTILDMLSQGLVEKGTRCHVGDQVGKPIRTRTFSFLRIIIVCTCVNPSNGSLGPSYQFQLIHSRKSLTPFTGRGHSFLLFSDRLPALILLLPPCVRPVQSWEGV
jgi:hypothetical protein